MAVGGGTVRHVVVLHQGIRQGLGLHSAMPTPARPERDASGIVAFPMTRSSKLKKVCKKLSEIEMQ